MSSIKYCTIFAGINGAGKSTLYSTLPIEHLGVRLNSDEIIVANNDSWQDLSAQIKAGKLLLQKQQECFDKNLSFNRETTLNGVNIINTIKTAQQKGYYVRLYYIGVDNPAIAKERVAKRVAKGGHGVSENTIDKRFVGATENLLRILPYCDEGWFYDNSGKKYFEVGVWKKNIVPHFSNPEECQWFQKIITDFENLQKNSSLNRKPTTNGTEYEH